MHSNLSYPTRPQDIEQDGETTNDKARLDVRNPPVPDAISARLFDMVTRNLDAIAADLDDRSPEPDACERRVRALATVTLTLDEIARISPQHAGWSQASSAPHILDAAGRYQPTATEDLSAEDSAGWVVDEDDPRAVPRDLETFRAKMSARLDRFGEKKNISGE